MELHFAIWGTNSHLPSLRESVDLLRQHVALAAEMGELFDVLEERAEHVPEPLDRHMAWRHHIPLAVHSHASLDEILAAFGRMTFERRNRLRQGVDFDPVTQSDLFFVTLEKAEGHYSPSTMYRDYAISPELFHWESQSTTSVRSPTGQRYLNHQARGTHVLLFVRHRKHEVDERLPTHVSAPRTMSHTNEAGPLRSPGVCIRPCPMISSESQSCGRLAHARVSTTSTALGRIGECGKRLMR